MDVEEVVRRYKAVGNALAQTPRIINTTIDGTEWSLMGELEVD